ncbi:hypothetical protein VNI00_008138 [Paramarasmius palmivorus]|uniref:BTB domain-containing protein n=1 Tax=Paramarasmius palmivorus TaxID=297713 RepID=A0AAW0CXN2_9AGAR
MTTNESSSTGAPTPKVTVASPPFDSPNVDIILRTADHVDFRVSRAILSFVSPFFRDMFALPQPPSSANSSDALEVVSLSEESPVLDRFLRFLYPATALPKLWNDEAENIKNIFHAMIKYQVEDTPAFKKFTQGAMNEFLHCSIMHTDTSKRRALRIMVILWSFKRFLTQDTLNELAKKLLEFPFHTLATFYCPEMDTITAGEYVKILIYHRKCTEAIQSHKPSFDNWGSNSARLKYSCTIASLTPRKASVPLANLQRLFDYVRKTEFPENPYRCTEYWSFGLPLFYRAFDGHDTGVHACECCSVVGCPSMITAFSRLISDEVVAAVNGVQLEL